MRYDVGRKTRKQKDGNAAGEDSLEWMLSEYLGGEKVNMRVPGLWHHGHRVNMVYRDTQAVSERSVHAYIS
jgi:hypothetical protein